MNEVQTAAAETQLVATENTFRLRAGTDLFYRAWLPALPTHNALVLFHRGHEHSGRWQETVESLGLEDVAVVAWDARARPVASRARLV